MNKELIEALNILEKEKDISKESLFEAIENNLVVAYKNNFNKADNVTVTMDRETGDFHIYSQKEVVEEVMDPVTEISLEDARSIKGTYELGDIVILKSSQRTLDVLQHRVQRMVSFRRLEKKKERAFTNSILKSRMTLLQVLFRESMVRILA